MTKKRTVIVMLLIVGVLLTLVGGASARQETPKFFLIAHGGPGNVFWVTVMKGMDDAAALLGVEATWLGADTASNEAMVGFWDDALAADPDGVGTTEPVPALIEDAVNRAVEAGIPVIAFNTQDTRPEGERLPHLFYVGSSEFLGGQTVARRLLADREITGVLCPIQEVGHTGLEARCNGVESVMAEEGIPVVRFTIDYNVSGSAGLIGDAFAANSGFNAIVTLGPAPLNCTTSTPAKMVSPPNRWFTPHSIPARRSLTPSRLARPCCALTSSPMSRVSIPWCGCS